MMKRRLFTALFAASALLTPVASYAYTVKELTDVAWIATYTSNPNFNGSSLTKAPLIDSHGVTATYIDDTHIRLNGIQGCLDFVFKLTNANGVETTDGEYLCITNNDYAVEVTASEYASQTWQMLQCVRSGYSYPIYTYKRTSDNLLFRISKNGDSYTMLSTTPVFVHGSADNGMSGYIIRIFDQVEMTSFVPNAIMTDRFYETYGFSTNGSSITSIYPTSPERKREYPVRVEMDYTKKRFTILNFGNNGYGLRENVRYYSNLYGTSIQWFADGKFEIGGSFDPDTKKLTFDKNQFAKPVWAPYGNGYYVQEDMFNFQLERLDLEGNTTVDELFGTYDDRQDVHHNNAPNGWVSHGGKRRTLEDVSMEVETYTYYLNQLLYNRINFEGGYYDTHIDCGDVTLQTEYLKETSSDRAPRTAQSTGSDPLAHVTFTQFNSGNEPGSQYDCGVLEWGIVPVMNVIRNEKYVESYEIMAVPGLYKTAEEVEAHIGEAVSFNRIFINNGTTLTQEDTNNFKADATKNGLYKPGDFRIARKTTGYDGETYTFFLKANYKPETGLTPTFHDVYPYTFYSTLPTAADAIDFGSVKVEGARGCINISGSAMAATVYNASGMQVYNGNDGHIELPAGIYIVKIDRKTYKVQVR